MVERVYQKGKFSVSSKRLNDSWTEEIEERKTGCDTVFPLIEPPPACIRKMPPSPASIRDPACI